MTVTLKNMDRIVQTFQNLSEFKAVGFMSLPGDPYGRAPATDIICDAFGLLPVEVDGVIVRLDNSVGKSEVNLTLTGFTMPLPLADENNKKRTVASPIPPGFWKAVFCFLGAILENGENGFKVTTLNLSANAIPNEDFKYLVDLVPFLRPTLKELDLCDSTYVSAPSNGVVCGKAPRKRASKTSTGKITNYLERFLLSLLGYDSHSRSYNSVLEVIDLECCGLTDDMVTSFMDTLHDAANDADVDPALGDDVPVGLGPLKLRDLFLGCNNLALETAQTVVDTLSSAPCIEYVGLMDIGDGHALPQKFVDRVIDLENARKAIGKRLEVYLEQWDDCE